MEKHILTGVEMASSPFEANLPSTEGETVGQGHNYLVHFFKGAIFYVCSAPSQLMKYMYMVDSGLFYRHPSVLVDRCQGITPGLREGLKN